MACNKLLFPIEMLDCEQWTATMETSFRGFLSGITSTIPKDLARWLLQEFDLAKITEKDVHATLALPMGQLEVQVASTCEAKNEHCKLLEQWRTRWNLGRIGSPKVRKMYNWCAFLLQCLNDLAVEWKQNRIRYFKGPLLLVMIELNLEGKDAKIDGETDLQEEFTSMALENQKHIDPATSTYGPPPAPEPHCSECRVISHIAHGRTNIHKCLNEVETHGLTHDERFFNDLEFFDAYLKMEAIVLKHGHRRTIIDYTPSTFDLGIPLSCERIIHVGISSPIKRTHTISSSPAYNKEQVCLGESEGQHTSMHAIPTLLCNILNRHITKRSKGNTMTDSRLKTSKELYEFKAPNKAHRLWIDKEAIASMAVADSYLENSILDTAILHAQKTSFKYHEFYKVFEHFFLVVFQFADKTVNAIDNLILPENPSARYGDCDTLLKSLSPNAETLLLKVPNLTWPTISRIYVKTDYQDNLNLHDGGIYTIHHMEMYYGDLQSWDHGFQNEKEALLRMLRAKYAARILLYPKNMLRDNALHKAKLESKARQQ
ncbi:hypothetical protein Cgig2_010257 [Carnegiea gigantea]|uniref:Uncharacterized protein n=1 Tax=Carnegiea gigantea TaxID=171969 RepID=A0A9Q1QCL8_9CARY|nr:hypothetical protein Cgig2_010257 [Carnegiea gigantea]